MLFKQLLVIVILLLSTNVAGFCQSYSEEPDEPGKEAKSSLTKKEMDALLDDSIKWLNKAKELLRLASVRLPEIVKDTTRFRSVDRAIETCREETYPAVAAADRLKKNPRALRSVVQL